MKKLLALAMALSLALSLAACGGGNDSNNKQNSSAGSNTGNTSGGGNTSGETYTFRCSTNHAETFPTGKALDEWSKLVKERTDGRINIEIYYNAVLGDEKSAIEQCQYGGLEFARVNISPMSEFVNDFNALSMPFIYQNTEHFYKALESIGMDMMHSQEMRDAGFYGLTWYDGGFRNFYTKTEVHTPADMAGMNIRVQESNLMISMVEALGAVATTMPFGDVYSGLQTGVVDGAENSMVQWLEMSHYEQAPYMVMDQHTSAPDMLIMSEKVRDILSEEDIEIISQAALDSWMIQRELWAEADAVAEEQLVEKGATVVRLSEDEFNQFKEACEPLWQSYEGGKYMDVINKVLELA